jgi:hypothetical protein
MPLIVTGMDPTDAPAEIVIGTVAITPEAIAFWFMPNIKTRTPPAMGLLEALLPALMAAWPVETVPLESEDENIRSN